jgi:hypothetical protein
VTQITPVRKYIEFEETQFRAAVSESTAQKIGSSINFINTYQRQQKQFFVSGKYAQLSLPFYGIDGLELMEVKGEIVNAFMYVRQAGTGGTTQFDLEYATSPGGSWTSVFSTKPSINYAAGGFAWCYVGSAFANTVAPVIGTSILNAGTALRANILTTQTGDTRGTGLIIYYRPTS